MFPSARTKTTENFFEDLIIAFWSVFIEEMRVLASLLDSKKYTISIAISIRWIDSLVHFFKLMYQPINYSTTTRKTSFEILLIRPKNCKSKQKRVMLLRTFLVHISSISFLTQVCCKYNKNWITSTIDGLNFVYGWTMQCTN